jgi:hypothetical protein
VKPVNPPSKHHYLPEGFQRGWANSNGQVVRYAVEHGGQVRGRHKAPAGVAWERDLYQIPGEPDNWKAAKLETEFFSRLDHIAAELMVQMRLTGRPPADEHGRSAWISFLVSLLHRTPTHMRATASKLGEMQRALMPDVERQYASIRGTADPKTFAEWEAAKAPDVVERVTLRIMMSLINTPRLGAQLINLRWTVIDLQSADYDLVLGDNPVILVPLRATSGHVACPVGPCHLFVASSRQSTLESIRKVPARRLVRQVNRLQVERADGVVIASDESQSHFIAKWFGTCRIGSIATGFKQPVRPRAR